MKKLFIIIDDKINSSVYADFFAAKGYVVATSHTLFGVINGLNVLNPDVVLVDMNMPGFDSKGVLDLLHDSRKYKIVLISGGSREEEMRALTLAGEADDYFVKGDPLVTLGDKISTLLGEKSQGRFSRAFTRLETGFGEGLRQNILR